MPKKQKKGRTDVDQEQVFWLNDGRVLKNLADLRNALKKMDDNTFAHHVNSERNDFANWIRDVVGEKKLATSVRRIKKKESLLKKVQAYLR